MYGFTTTLTGEGFGVLSDIDVQRATKDNSACARLIDDRTPAPAV